MRYQDIPALDEDVTTFTVDGRSYTVTLDITPESPMDHTTTVVATVDWALGINPGEASDERRELCVTMDRIRLQSPGGPVYGTTRLTQRPLPRGRLYHRFQHFVLL